MRRQRGRETGDLEVRLRQVWKQSISDQIRARPPSGTVAGGQMAAVRGTERMGDRITGGNSHARKEQTK
jgi:hypothetical protein